MDDDRLPGRTREAYDGIKRRILALELPPGATFTEAQLADALQLSKTPVREALLRLRQERLVDAVARTGYRVSPVTVKHARDLFHLRTLLEVEAAGMAAERGVKLGSLLELERICGEGHTNDRDSITAFMHSNMVFHVTLARLGGNDALAAMLEQVLEQLERLFHMGLALSMRGFNIVHEHRELLGAVKRGDVATARRLAGEQVATAHLMVLDALLSSEAVLSASIMTSEGALP